MLRLLDNHDIGYREIDDALSMWDDIEAGAKIRDFELGKTVNSKSYPDHWEAPHEPNGIVIRFELTDPDAIENGFYRLHSKGPEANPEVISGRWYAFGREEIDARSPAQVNDFYAIPGEQAPNAVAKVDVPKGTELRISRAADNGFAGDRHDGGGVQIEVIVDDDPPGDWYQHSDELTEALLND